MVTQEMTVYIRDIATAILTERDYVHIDTVNDRGRHLLEVNEVLFISVSLCKDVVTINDKANRLRRTNLFFITMGKNNFDYALIERRWLTTVVNKHLEIAG